MMRDCDLTDKTRLILELRQIAGQENVLEKEPMSRHTTFQAGGEADIYVRLSSEKGLLEALELLEREKEPYFLLGKGSNLLVGDGGFRGTILTLAGSFADISVNGQEITAGAGALLGSVSRAAMENGLTGLEFASGIPGSVGGGIVMNAGAYGGEMAQVIREVAILFPGEGIRTVPAEEMRFGYRASLLKERKGIVLGAVVSLKQGSRDEIRDRIEELAAMRKSKQPLEYASAGSTFKRPEGYFAGKLISDAGLKGFCAGPAQVSEKHAGFVINRGGASARQIRDVIEAVTERVYEASGIRLEREVIYLGEF